MEIYISIDGVLRNLIQKFDYHYRDYFLEREEEVTEAILIDDEGNEKVDEDIEESFEYEIKEGVKNDNLLDYYKFKSIEEYENFMFIEFPIEIYGHAGLSYSTAVSDLNKFIYDNKEHNITLIGIDEFGKAKPSTLFFLSKNGCLVNSIKFIKSDKIEDVWNDCDIWVTDSEKIINLCPEHKKPIKFSTIYNNHFTNSVEINKLSDIKI